MRSASSSESERAETFAGDRAATDNLIQVLGGMSELLAGKVQAGFGNAARWLNLFNAAYSEKLGMSVFPGSLNIALDHVFNWFDARYGPHRIWFGREEYGGERDILLLPCELVSLDRRKAFLWTPTTAARDRRDPWVVEIVSDVNLRHHFGLQDGDVVEIRLPMTRVQG
jgi:CTP-dependent riboflavin kinase